MYSTQKYIVVLDGDLTDSLLETQQGDIHQVGSCLWYMIDVMPSCCKFIPLPSGPGVHFFCGTYGLHITVCASCAQIHYTIILNGSHDKNTVERFVFCVFCLYVIKYSKIA